MVQKDDVILCWYCQPVNGGSFRVGKIEDVQQLTKQQYARLNLHSKYRQDDPEFFRGTKLVTLRERKGYRKYYSDRMAWYLKLPKFLGRFF